MPSLWPGRADGPCGKPAPQLRSPPRIDGPPSFHARVLRRALGTDRCRAPPAQEDGLRPQDPAPGTPAGDDRAPGSTRPQQRPDRRRNPPARGHRAPLARPIRGRPGARPGRPQAVGAASDVHRAADRRSQSTGLPVTGRDRRAAVALVMPRTRARGRHPGYHRHDLRLHCAPLAQGRRTQALAAPFLDLHPRPELPRHRSTGPGPVRAHLRWHPARRGPVRHLRGRKDLHPGPLSLPSHPGPRPGPFDARQPHLRARRSPGLPGRLRHPPGRGLRPLRTEHRHRAVHETG